MAGFKSFVTLFLVATAGLFGASKVGGASYQTACAPANAAVMHASQIVAASGSATACHGP
jgi:hypothetical protein